jgi:putative iron-dependent peroxidase
VDEAHGFKYFDERDRLGFVDGTEMPTGLTAVRAATIADENPEIAGGSYVIAQKYLYDLRAWNAPSGARAGMRHWPDEARRHRTP